MAKASSKEAICSLVEDGTLELEWKAARYPYYTGLVTSADTLMVVELDVMNLQLYSRHNGKLLATSDRLESIPRSVCLISNTEVCVILENRKIVILSFKSIDDVKRVKTLDLTTVFDRCHAVAKVKSTDKVVVSGKKQGMRCWCVVSLTDGHVDTIHTICKGGNHSHLAIKSNTVYISCRSYDSTVRGVYAYDIFNPHTQKFLYQHRELYGPCGLTVDTRGFIFVCDYDSNSIHQLTDRGELVTIHRVSSRPRMIFYEDQHGVLYTTSLYSNEITRYRLEYLHQPGIPIEILNMDDRSIQLFEEALKDGKETVCSIRVMVVGHMGVGKTTLIKRLLGEEVNISERHSTDGIEVYVNCCDVSLSTCEWTRRIKDSEQDYRLQRLARVLNEQQSVRDKVAEEERVIIAPQGERTLKSHEGDHVAVEDKDIEVLYHRSPQRDFGQDFSSTISQQEDTHSALVQSKLIKSETNTIAMLKLLQENADKLKQDTGKTSPLTVWDFAGQYAFYTTHQTFLTTRAIYLLVSDVSEQLTDLVDDECYFDTEGIMKCKVHELVEVWLNSIHSCAPSPEAGTPPVILVGTHVDKIVQRYCHEICERYFRDIRTCLKDKPTRFHLADEDFAIDNTVVDSRLEDLKRKIVEVASQQPYWQEMIPARWLILEQELIRLKAAGIKVIHRSLLEDLNKAGAVQIAKDELDLFLRLQHDVGTILYFSMELLEKKIVLDPQWMIDALKSLITAEMFVLRSTPAVSDKWFEFKDKGKLSLELVDAVWTKQKHPDLHDNKEHILLLMEQLNIIAKLRLCSEDALEIKEENYFLAPCMLRQKTPRDVIYPVPHPQMESSSVLCYVFVGKYLPSPIFHRLLAACVAHWPIATKKKENILENLIFCGCCVFQLDHYHKLTLHFKDYIIFMRITRMGITNKTPSSKLCIEVREFVTAMLIKILGYLGQSLKFEHFIQCPEYTGDSINSLIPVSLLKENAEVCCDFHDNMIESNNLLKFWFMDMGSQGEKGGDTAPVSIVPVLASSSTLASTDVPSPSPKSGPTPNTAAGSMSSPTSGSTPSKTTGSTPSPTSSSTTANVMQVPTSGSTPFTTDGLMQALTSGSTPSTTTGSTPSPTSSSTTADVMQTATSSSTTADVMQTTTSGSIPSTTVGPIPAPTLSSTAAGLLQAQTSSSTPSTTAGPMPAPTSGSTTANVMQVPTFGSTTADVMQASLSGSTPSTTAGPMPAPTSSSTTADVMQAPTVDDTDRFMHIACLLVNVGSRVLRRLLLHHTVTPTCTLDQYLANNRIAIDSLKKRRILNNSQMDILFPPGGSTNLGDYDITLVSALFNNIVSTISQQQLNMIQFLRDERNEIFAHAKSVTVNSNDYQKFWDDISLTLVALSKQCGDPDFENEISKEIQGIQISTVQGTSFHDTLQAHPRRIETLERLVQALISSHAQESNKASDDSDS